MLDDAFIEVTVLDETASEATEATETTTEPEVVEGEVETASNESDAEVEEAETADIPTPSSIKKQPREAVVAQAKELGIELDYDNEPAVTKQVMADAIVAALKAQKEAAEAAPEA